MKLKIILLDYQATLVENFAERQAWLAIPANRRKPYTEWIKLERMRMKLVEMLRSGKYYVILITARSTKYQDLTIDLIKERCGGWLPDEWHFNEWEIDPPICKESIMKKYVFPKHGTDPERYFAIESNEKTRRKYSRMGIKALRYDESWTEIP